jgi:hypothetical protein
MDRMPQLRIHRDLYPTVLRTAVSVLVNMPGGTTFSVQRLDGDKQRLWMSKRGYDYLQRKLAEMQERGEL